MDKKGKISRRNFVSSALTAGAAAAVLPTGRLIAGVAGNPFRSGYLLQDAPGILPTPSWKDQGVENLVRSPHAKLKNIPVRAVTIHEGFWYKRRQININKSIPSMHDLLESNGRMENFRRLTGKSTAAQSGPVYSDSDIYKWTEAVGFTLQSGPYPELRASANRFIDDVVAAQQPNGYLNTYYVGDKASQIMLPATQTTGHELYNMGHYLQGAIAYYRGTGDPKMLEAGMKFVNDFLLPNYGPAPLKPIVSGHPEIEMGLIELYRMTGDKRQLDLAGYILRGDDRIELPAHRTIYMFSGTPFTARTKLEGHAVRAMYACCGATDYYMETGDDTYLKTLNTLWNDLTATKMYITGGVGARQAGEAFGDAYELPNALAYGESCAAIGNMMWNWRMLAVTGDAKFADVIERALYNGINSGMSLDGTLYCYRNPLAFDPATGDTIRNTWYDTTCCPPNLERTFASLPGYFYSTSGDGIYVHLYDNSDLDWKLENGTGLKISQKTNYPWDGGVSLTVTPAQTSDFTIYLRIPGWCDRAQVSVNGSSVSGAKAGEYLAVHRSWAAGDTIQLKLEMTPQVLEANPHVVEDEGRVALQRGPLVYCLEELDQPSGTAIEDVSVNIGHKPSDGFKAEFKPDLLGGVMVLQHEGELIQYPDSRNSLYTPYQQDRPKNKPVELTFIPYYAWANRDKSPMQVWTRLTKV
jgi:uncharacterized protein